MSRAVLRFTWITERESSREENYCFLTLSACFPVFIPRQGPREFSRSLRRLGTWYCLLIADKDLVDHFATMDAWKPLLHLIQMGSTLFGMSMNSILILLILYRSPQNLGVYKILMVYISVFELFFGVLELTAAPVRLQNLQNLKDEEDSGHLDSRLCVHGHH